MIEKPAAKCMGPHSVAEGKPSVHIKCTRDFVKLYAGEQVSGAQDLRKAFRAVERALEEHSNGGLCEKHAAELISECLRDSAPDWAVREMKLQPLAGTWFGLRRLVFFESL